MGGVGLILYLCAEDVVHSQECLQNTQGFQVDERVCAETLWIRCSFPLMQIPKNSNYPKQHPQYKYFEHELLLHRPGPSEKIEPNVIVFKVDESLSKPELKQYLEKVYGMQVEKINTARFMGKVVMTPQRQFKKTKPFKKAFVFTSTQIPPTLNQKLI